jgi:predicted permease
MNLMRQLTVESLLLTLGGGALGCVSGIFTISAAISVAPASIPRFSEVSIDGKVLAFALLLSLIVAGALSASSLGVALKAHEGGVLRASRGSVGDRWNHRLRRLLLIGEISAAAVLLLATTALLNNLGHMRDIWPGFSPDFVFQAQVSVPPTYLSADDLGRFYDRVSERLIQLPGVRHVGVTSVAPLSGLLLTAPFTVEGEAQNERTLPNLNLRIITPDYLAAVGTRLVAGRHFTEADRWDTTPVGLVSAAFAARFLHGAAVGRRVRINDNNTGPRPVEIVGVVENVREEALDAPAGFNIYLPLRQVHPDRLASVRNYQFWMIRTTIAPSAVRLPFVAQLRAVDHDAGVSGMSTMREYVEAALGPRRFNLGLYAAFALTGVILAVVGMYGLISYAVSQRQREIGLRMAIGATERDIHQMILRQAAFLGISGTLLGGCLAAIAHRFIGPLAQGISISISSAVINVALLVGLMTAAAWLPARRAARIPPAVALRAE